MPGTRTAPDVTGTATYKTAAMQWIDWTGQRRSDNYQFPVATTNAQIEAVGDALQALSNASLWRIEVASVFAGDMDSGAAAEEVYESVESNVVILLKKTDNTAIDFFIPSVIEGLFVENTDDIDQTNADLATLEAALEAAMGAGYTVRGNRFSKRSKRGKFQPK